MYYFFFNITIDVFSLSYPTNFRSFLLIFPSVSSSSKWKEFTADVKRPALYKAVLDVKDKTPKDTFVDMTVCLCT